MIWFIIIFERSVLTNLLVVVHQKTLGHVLTGMWIWWALYSVKRTNYSVEAGVILSLLDSRALVKFSVWANYSLSSSSTHHDSTENGFGFSVSFFILSSSCLNWEVETTELLAVSCIKVLGGCYTKFCDLKMNFRYSATANVFTKLDHMPKKWCYHGILCHYRSISWMKKTKVWSRC